MRVSLFTILSGDIIFDFYPRFSGCKFDQRLRIIWIPIQILDSVRERHCNFGGIYSYAFSSSRARPCCDLIDAI